MKKLVLALATLLSTAAAHANQPCASLQKYVGNNYKLLSKTCDDTFLFGESFSVKPDIENGSLVGYHLTSGAMTVSPSIADSGDTCVDSGTTLTVQTCAAGDQSCIPRGWTYAIGEKSVEYSANGCDAKYSAK